MSRISYLIGVPASGKSEFAKELAKKERAEILAADRIRLELFGDETKQKKVNIVFKALFEKAHSYLENGVNVIIDATNIERERRMRALKYFAKYEKHCYYFDTPYEEIIKRNKKRKRKVDEYIIKEKLKETEFPTYAEGWAAIHFVHHSEPYSISKDEFIDIVSSVPSYEELFDKLSVIPLFKQMVGFDQENPYHKWPLCRHTYGVYKGISDVYDFEDRLAIQIASLLHDAGKPFSKKYKKVKGYYSFYGHEFMSCHMAIHLLKELGFSDEFVYKVAQIIQFHMTIMHNKEQGQNIIYHLLGSDYLWKLCLFKEADENAK